MDSTEQSYAGIQRDSLPDRQLVDFAVTLADACPNSCDRSQLQRLSPAALAYIGDAVYELYVRTRYLMPPKRLQTYHQQVVAQVRAERQAEQLALLQPCLSEAEQMVARVKSNESPVWYLMASDEGHGFRKKNNADFQFYATVLFIEKYLLGK